MPRRLPVHPFLFALFPILFLFGANVVYVGPAKIALPIAFALIVTGVALSLATLAYRSILKAAVAVSALVVLFFSYGHVVDVAGGSGAGRVVARDTVLLVVWAALAFAATVLARRIRDTGRVTFVLNGLALGMIVVTLVTAGVGMAGRTAPRAGHGKGSSEQLPVSHTGAQTARDIYYIIFDRYSGPDVLRDHFRFDNAKFLDYLRGKGFYVAAQSVSNYPKTDHSLAASMNLEYLDGLAETVGPDATGLKHVDQLLDATKVSRFLQNKGYTFANIGSWWEATAEDPSADVNYRYSKRSEFSQTLLETTLARSLPGVSGPFDLRRIARNTVPFQLDRIREASGMAGPTYVFAHFMLPHCPFIFHGDGTYMTREEERPRTLRDNYVGQVVYTNAKIRELVDQLLDVPRDERPFIILQADEGQRPYVPGCGGSPPPAWLKATTTELRLKFPILNAYYFPDGRYEELYPSITPVNSFRLLFDRYFGTRLGLLPDRAFVFSEEKPYEFHEVTDRVRPS